MLVHFLPFTPTRRHLFQTNIVVECPAGCGDMTTLPVFGSDGVYAARSSVCKAAVHAGLIQSGGTFVVALESPSLSFDGSVQNGVESKSLNLPAGEVVRSMRLFKMREVCFTTVSHYC